MSMLPFVRFITVLQLLFCTAICSTSWAKEVRLFSNGEQVSNYKELLSNLEKDDVLIFEDQTRYRFIKVLGSGNMTEVIRVQPLDAILSGSYFAMRLRIDVNSVARQKGFLTTYSQALNYFIEFNQIFEKAELSPKVYRALKNEYVLLEEVQHKFSLYEFFEAPLEISKETRLKAEKAFLPFARKIAAFHVIGDFSLKQVVFDGQNWRVLDFMKSSLLQGNITAIDVTANLLYRFESDLYDFPKDTQEYALDWLENIDRNIYRERLRMIIIGENSVSKQPIQLLPDRVGRVKQIETDLVKMSKLMAAELNCDDGLSGKFNKLLKWLLPSRHI